MFLSEVQILATPCDVHVDERGTFYVHLKGHGDAEEPRDGALAIGSPLGEVIEKAKPEVRKRKVKVAVPFYRRVVWRGEASFEQGTATGFHAGTGNVMATFHGDSEQLSGGSHRDPFLRADTPEEVRADMLRMEREIMDREKALKALRAEWAIEIEKAVKAAIEAKQAPAVTA